MASNVPPKKNTALTFYMSLVSQADVKLFQVNPTLAAGDVKVAIDDAAPANITTLPTVDADFTRRIKVSLSAAEMNGDSITVIFSDAAGAEWCDVTLDIPTVTNTIDGTLTEPSAVPAWATATTSQWLAWLGALSRNKVTSDADSVNLRNDADSADIAAFATSDDGSTFSSGEAT